MMNDEYGWILVFSLIIGGCSGPDNSSPKVVDPTKIHKTMEDHIDVKIGSFDDLMALFDERNYNREAWANGNREVPRITFEGVSENWKKTSQDIPVTLKKDVFFRLMAPLVLVSNERILLERSVVKSEALSSERLNVIAVKYRVLNESTEVMTESLRLALLEKVDIMPPSLALAQAAEESGWATSRFTEEGNAFFGQWDFSGKGVVPARQRKELGNYGLARFDSPLASVEGYMYNINITAAYKKLRTLRALLRSNNEKITGLALVVTLDKYSERGQAYIDSITGIIKYNRLQDVDDAYLSGDKLLHLVKR